MEFNFEASKTRMPHNDQGSESPPDDFPIGIEIFTFQNIQDAIDARHSRQISKTIPTMPDIANELKTTAGVVDFLESLWRMTGAERDRILDQIHKSARRSYDTYLNVRAIVRDWRDKKQPYVLEDLSRAMGRGQIWAHQYFLYSLRCYPEVLGFPKRSTERAAKPKIKRPAENLNIRLHQAYANAVREVVASGKKLDAAAVAEHLSQNSIFKITPETVALFLSQKENADFIERAKRNEI